MQRLVEQDFSSQLGLASALGDPWTPELSGQKIGFGSRRLMGRNFLSQELPEVTEKHHLILRSVLRPQGLEESKSIRGPEADGLEPFSAGWTMGRVGGVGDRKPQLRSLGCELSGQPRSSLQLPGAISLHSAFSSRGNGGQVGARFPWWECGNVGKKGW